MKKNDSFKLDVISGIDEEIIDRATERREKLLRHPMISFRKKLIALGSLAAMMIALFSGILIFGLGEGRQIPVYTGMTVSHTNPMLGRGTDNVQGAMSQGTALIGDNNGHRYDGDYDSDDKYIDKDKPFGEENDSIEDVVGSTVTAIPEEDIYYAKPGEDVFITIHIDNPDGFEILSFTLNGNKYSSYMFEYGSDLENLILKVNVGDSVGIVEYTIDQIKYVDGTEIKDVKMDGDETVRIGVYTENQPVATVTELMTAMNSISFKVNVNDPVNLIGLSNGKIQALLYDGDKDIRIVEVTGNGQTVTFDGLKRNTLYQYAIVLTYDRLDGEGVTTIFPVTDALYTQAPVLFDNIEVGYNGVSFTYKWYSELTEKVLTSVAVYDGSNNKVKDVPTDSLIIDGLLPNTGYTVVAEYKMGENTEAIEIEITTIELQVPDFDIKDIAKSKDSIRFTVSETDNDNIGAVTKIELLLDGTLIKEAESFDTVEFKELLIGKVYTVRITYVYDLYDGAGEQTVVKSAQITTDQYEKPLIDLWETTVTQTEISFYCELRDADGIGRITKIELIHNGVSVEAESTDIRSFSGLHSNNLYTVKVTYAYDLMDGRGEITKTEFINVITEARTAPLIKLTNGKNTGTSFSFDITVTDTDSSVTVTSIKLLDGITEIASSEIKDKVVFAIPSARKEYVAKVTYTYDLNDGEGIYTEDVILGSWTPSEGLEIENGVLVGIGTCTDKILFIDKPVFCNIFEGNTNIEEVYFLKGATMIGCFKNCVNLKYVHMEEGVENIDGSAFENCVSLEEIRIPSTVKRIGCAAFQNCQKLKRVLFSEDAVITNIEGWAFSKCNMLESICIPDSVLKIDSYAFMDCTSLKNIVFGKSSKLTAIEAGAFYNCSSLVRATVPNTVSIIELNVFTNCMSLTEAIIPDGVTYVKHGAFFGCMNLKAVVIPASVTMMEGNVFDGCINAVIYYEGSQAPSTWIMNWNPLNRPIVFNARENTYNFETNGGSPVDSITGYAVTDAPVTSKEGFVLAGWYDNAELNGNPVEFPYSSKEKTVLYAKWINEYVFNSNGGTSVENGKTFVIEDSPVTAKDGYIFIGWYDNAELNGKPVEFPYSSNEKTTLYAKWFDLEGNSINEGFEINEFGYITGIGECTDKVLYITRPVADSAFAYNTTIEKVYLLYGATTVDTYAFKECPMLKYVYIGEGVETVYTYAFEYCNSLETVYVSSTVKSIGWNSFYSCENLKNVIFDENAQLTGISSWCFSGCKSLKTIRIPSSVTTIGSYAFGDSGIEKVTFAPNSKLNIIEHIAFGDCHKLESIEIPEGITVIEESLFSNCHSLKEIVVPAGVTTIKKNAFAGCYALGILVIPDSVVIIGSNALFGENKAIVLYEGSEIPATWNTGWNPHGRPVILNARKNTYTFETNGGSIIDSITDYTVGISYKPVKDGFIFVGWYDNPELTGNPVELPYYSDKKTTLYARWLDPSHFEESEGLIKVDGVINGIGDCTDDVLFINSPVSSFAFNGCNTVKHVYFGEGATSIGNSSFQSCTSLITVTFASNISPNIGAKAFGYSWSKDEFKVYVPEEKYEYYKNCTAENWQTYIVEAGKLYTY